MKILGQFALIAASLFLSASAFATHKSWVLQHAGGQCAYDASSPATGQNGAGDYGDIFLWNSYSSSRSAECPLILANRWGSSGTSAFDVHRWAEAKSAYVHVYEGSSSQAFTCQAVARLRVLLAPGGALYFGTAGSISGVGNHTLELINSKSWGSTLEANEQALIRSIDYQCIIPPDSAVRGYGVKLCQNWADCADLNGPRDDFQENSTYVQGNGADCTSWGLPTARGADGLSINGSGSDFRTHIVCPILPPALDSYEHTGSFIKRVRLYVAGGFGGASPGPGCEVNHGCPSCYIDWEERDSGARNSSSTFTWNSAGYLEMPGSQLTMLNVPSAMAITCLGYAGQRIRGYTMEMSETRVSSGQ